jgi:aryl-alcohol dehydrogenase-like predicted oxidoreductase
MNDRGWAVLGILDEIAVAHGATVGQVALAWLMAQDTVTAPIASATSPEQVRELMGATMLSLTEQERDRLSAATAAL